MKEISDESPSLFEEGSPLVGVFPPLFGPLLFRFRHVPLHPQTSLGRA